MNCLNCCSYVHVGQQKKLKGSHSSFFPLKSFLTNVMLCFNQQILNSLYLKRLIIFAYISNLDFNKKSNQIYLNKYNYLKKLKDF